MNLISLGFKNCFSFVSLKRDFIILIVEVLALRDYKFWICCGVCLKVGFTFRIKRPDRVIITVNTVVDKNSYMLSLSKIQKTSVTGKNA
jgi:hypothetical protein